MLSAAVSIRSTALFLSLVLGAPILSTFWDNLNKGRILNVIKVGITGAVTLLSFCVVFVVYLYYGYREFCISEPKSWFCEDLLPNIYSAVQ
jgi:glucose-6-phosphate-specific signal transduction histidine kinase